MKISKLLYPLSLLILITQAHADGGSGSNSSATCSGSVVCPTGQAGSISFKYRLQYYDRGRCPSITNEVKKRLQQNQSNKDIMYYIGKATGYHGSQNITINRNCVNAAPAPAPAPVPVPPPLTVIPPTVPKVSVPANYDSLCNEGYTGKIRHVFSIYYTMETYNTVMSDGTPTTAQASTPHVSESITNGCEIIKTTTTKTEQGSKVQTCDSYYGAASGTYSGLAYIIGTYTSTYDQNSKQTSTSFATNNNDDISSCKPQFTDTSMERRLRPCPAGQVGEIQEYIYKAVNTRGETVYPYGKDWLLTSNSCADTQTDTALADDTAAAPNGLLSNVSITSSDLRMNDRFSNYLGALSGSGWKSSQKQKLVIEVDDLHTGSFNAAKLGLAISKFQTVVGSENAEVEIKLPRTIDKFVGASGITQQAVQNKSISMKSVKFDGYDAEVTYWEIGNGSISKLQEKSVKINIVPKGIGLKNISGE